MSVLLLCAAAFLIGSIPCGYLLGRMQGIDLRQQGSGNTGAANVNRVLGRKAGLLILLLDTVKGAAGVSLAFLWPGNEPFPSGLAAVFGFFSVLGHCFSPFLKFRGGKGVATSLGVFMVLTPLEMTAGLLLFAATVKLSRYVSLGSLVAACSVPALIFLRREARDDLILLVALLTALVIIIRHRTNIVRLVSKTELPHHSPSALQDAKSNPSGTK